MRVAGRQLSGPAGVKTGKSADGLSVQGLPHCEFIFFDDLLRQPTSLFFLLLRGRRGPKGALAQLCENLFSPSHGGGYFQCVGCRRRGPGSVTGWDAGICLPLPVPLSGLWRFVFLVSAAGSLFILIRNSMYGFNI